MLTHQKHKQDMLRMIKSMKERYKGGYHRGIDIFTVINEEKRNRLPIFMGNDIYLLSLRNIEFEREISLYSNRS